MRAVASSGADAEPWRLNVVTKTEPEKVVEGWSAKGVSCASMSVNLVLTPRRVGRSSFPKAQYLVITCEEA